MRIDKLNLNTRVAAVLFLVSLAAYLWTFTSQLSSGELFVPRISILLVGVGAVLVIIQDMLKPASGKPLQLHGTLRYLAAILLVLWLYSWSFRHIGLVVSTFVFLSAWWSWYVYSSAKRAGTFDGFKRRLVKVLLLAAAVAVLVQLLFVELLSIYLPRPLLF